MARNILYDGHYVSNGEHTLHRPPGWPLTLAAIYRTLGTGRRQTVAVQSVFDAGTILTTGWLAAEMFASPLAGALAFGVTLAWPPLARECRLMQTEPMFTLFVSLLFVVFFRFTVRPSLPRALLVGVVAGLGTLVRPTGLVVLGSLGIGWLVQGRARALRQFGYVAAIGLAFMLVLAPWTYRNYRVSGAFVPVSVGTGEQLFLGALLETDGRWKSEVWTPIRDGLIRKHEVIAVTAGRNQARSRVDGGRPRDLARASDRERDHHRETLLPAGPAAGGRAGPGDRQVGIPGRAARAVPAHNRGRHPRAQGARCVRGYGGVLLVMTIVFALANSSMYAISRFYEPVRGAFLVLAAGAIARLMARRTA